MAKKSKSKPQNVLTDRMMTPARAVQAKCPACQAADLACLARGESPAYRCRACGHQWQQQSWPPRWRQFRRLGIGG